MPVHTLLSSFALALLAIGGLAAILALLLVVLVEVRCLVRLTDQLGPVDPDEAPAGFFAAVAPHPRRHQPALPVPPPAPPGGGWS